MVSGDVVSGSYYKVVCSRTLAIASAGTPRPYRGGAAAAAARDGGGVAAVRGGGGGAAAAYWAAEGLVGSCHALSGGAATPGLTAKRAATARAAVGAAVGGAVGGAVGLPPSAIATRPACFGRHMPLRKERCSTWLG